MINEQFDEKEKTFRALKGPQWNRREHGSLYDRGSADSYYRRGPSPHYGGIAGSIMQECTDLTPEERAEYMAGYNDNEKLGEFKDWG